MITQSRFSVHFAVAGSAIATFLFPITAYADSSLNSYVEISTGDELGTDQVDMSTGGWIRTVATGTIDLVPEIDILDGATVRFSAIPGSDLNLKLYRVGTGAELHFGGGAATRPRTNGDFLI